jgi:putative ABC transport system substrate-binding protein
VNRRTFLGTLAGGLLAAPLASQAQQAGKVYRIGLLGLASASDRSGVAALREGLQDLGYEEGKNLVIEYRWAEGQYDRLPGFAAELVRLKVDAIVTYGTPGALAAKQATKTIPVVVAIMGDAVATGVVATLVRPGGNITGSQFHFPQIMAKRIELLKKALPRLTRAAVLTNVANHSFPPALKAMEDAARSLGLELQQAEVRSPDDFGSAFAAMAKRRAEAFIVADDPMLRSHGQTIAKLAAQRQLPSVGEREYVERRAAGLRGEASRGVAPSGGLHRQNPEMRQAGRSAVRADRPGRDDG